MHNALLSILVIALSATTLAANVTSSDSQKLSITAQSKIQVKVVETIEACVFTYDPQWADEEDTREARIIFENYKKTNILLKKLAAEDFEFAGYQNKESCSVDSSTFPEVLTSTDSLYFSRFVPITAMVRVSRAQKAFKKVRRVYLKGFKTLETKVKKEISLEKTQLLKKYL